MNYCIDTSLVECPISPSAESVITFAEFQSQLLAIPMNSIIPIIDRKMETEMFYTAYLVQTFDIMWNKDAKLKMVMSALEEPNNVHKILKYCSKARDKLVKYFLWIQKKHKQFIKRLVTTVHLRAMQNALRVSTEVSEEFECTLRLATFLMEGGWYTESLAILKITEKQCADDPNNIVSVLRIQLFAETFSRQFDAALVTIERIKAFLMCCEPFDVDLSVLLHHALSVSYFELCMFNYSFTRSLKAFRLLEERCSPVTAISVYRQMAKCCIQRSKPHHAKLLLTQAVALTSTHFGSDSVNYAEALEDQVFFLVAVNASFEKLYKCAQDIYSKKYGADFQQCDDAQGYLPLAAFLKHILHWGKDKNPDSNILEDFDDLQFDDELEEMEPITHRRYLAAKRVKHLVAAKIMCQRGSMKPGDYNFDDQDVVRQMSVMEVKYEFDQLR